MCKVKHQLQCPTACTYGVALATLLPRKPCCTDTAKMVHQRLARADEAVRRNAGGVRWARTRTYVPEQPVCTVIPLSPDL